MAGNYIPDFLFCKQACFIKTNINNTYMKYFAPIDMPTGVMPVYLKMCYKWQIIQIATVVHT